MLVEVTDATVRDVVDVERPEEHLEAGCAAPHLKQSCLKLQPKHLSPW